MHEIWCLGSDGITCEVQATAQIDVGAEIVGQFATQYIAEYGHRVPVIGQISFNRTVKICAFLLMLGDVYCCFLVMS